MMDPALIPLPTPPSSEKALPSPPWKALSNGYRGASSPPVGDAATALRADHYTDRQRARYGAIRQRIFAAMSRDVATSRLMWILGFNIFSLSILLPGSEFGVRSVVIAVAMTSMTACHAIQALYSSSEIAMLGSTLGGTVFYFICVGATGGLASPLIYPGLMLLMHATLKFADRPQMKRLFFGLYLMAFVVLGLLHRTAVGRLAPPLSIDGSTPSFAYELLALASIATLVRGLFRMGDSISAAYERVGLELAERREELCSETEERTKALEGIAARLAHEVKNPLAAIKGLSTHMARTAATPKEAERLQIVASEADRLQTIVEGFLSFSRGFDDLKPAPTAPYELARELTLLLETRASDVGVMFQLTGDSDISVTADARKLRQAMLNLVLNALQASPRGGMVTLDVSKSHLGTVRIRVADEGPGMSFEVLERIKRPYFTTKEGGTGLGVAVARGIIEQHGGQLHYESAPGRGTAVTIELLSCAISHCMKTSLPNPLRRFCGEAADVKLDAKHSPDPEPGSPIVSATVAEVPAR